MIHDDSRKINPNDTFLAIDKGKEHINRNLLLKTKKIILLDKKNIYPYLYQLWELKDSKIKIIGVTGTNGKTTFTYLLKKIIDSSGGKARIIGTINSKLTTPEMFEIVKTIKDMQEKNETHLIMEVSSIGIIENRIYGLNFEVKVLTNITHDHLDYHKTFKEYVKSKFLFLNLPGKTIYPTQYKKIKIDFPTKLKGKFNKHNLQSAYASALALNIPESIIKKALSEANPPKGRFEPIDTKAPFEIIIDYAHTPDGLDNILKTAKEMTPHKLICVFGAGGDRDRKKRPEMGEKVSKWADIIIITSDNPRTEDPSQIIRDILQGVTKNTTIEPDREKAIHLAIKMAKEKDIIVIAGKGHEDYQILKDKTIPFDDAKIAKEYTDVLYR